MSEKAGVFSTPPTTGIVIPASWGKRIPAAIKKGEGYLNGTDYRAEGTFEGETVNLLAVTAGEVALAKAIFPYWDHGEGPDAFWDPLDDALMAFTEKIEKLT